jgi:hypothetical protein
MGMHAATERGPAASRRLECGVVEVHHRTAQDLSLCLGSHFHLPCISHAPVSVGCRFDCVSNTSELAELVGARASPAGEFTVLLPVDLAVVSALSMSRSCCRRPQPLPRPPRPSYAMLTTPGTLSAAEGYQGTRGARNGNLPCQHDSVAMARAAAPLRGCRAFACV